MKRKEERRRGRGRQRPGEKNKEKKKKKVVKKMNMDEAQVQRYMHFCPKIMPNFSFQFSFHFGEKTFWWAQRENT